MKDLAGTLLALVFALLSLASLLSANPDWQRSYLDLPDETKISELGLRFNPRR